MNHKNIYKWGLNKPHHIRTLALNVALAISDYQEMLADAKHNKHLDSFDKINKDEWFSFYHKSKKLLSFSLTQLLPLDPSATKLVAETIDIRSKSPNPTNHNDQLWRDHIELSFKATQPPTDISQLENMKDIVFSTQFAFTIQVATPCWFFYQEPHSLLFKKATQGNTEELCKLLRLDQFLIQHPKIHRWLTLYRTPKHIQKHEAICNALQSTPIGKVELRSVKDMFAGLIAFLTQKDGHELKPNQLKKLFDSIAKDRDHLGVDEDYCNLEDDSFRILINRKKNKWQSLIK